MVDAVSPVGSALQAVLTGDLLKTLESALASGSITDAPASIQNTTTPLAIGGTLLSQLQDGSAVLQTAAGPVALALQNNTPPLPQGTLTLLIQPGNPPTASIINNQALTPQAQIQTQATAAQQTQDVQTQPLQALPPITVGQVLTATPLPQATTSTIVQPAPIETDPVPIVSQAASSAAVAAAIATELPIAVLLNSAIPPAPSAPTATFVKPQPFVVDEVEPSPEEEAVSMQTGQAQTRQAPQAQNQPLDELPPLLIDTDLDEDQEVSTPVNLLAAQESANDAAPVTSGTIPLAYNPGVTLPPTQPQAAYAAATAPATPQAQDFLVLKVTAPLADGTAPQPLTQTAQTMTATVVAQTSSGQPLLETSGGAMLVSQRVSSPVGTELTLQRVAQDETAPGAAQAVQSRAPVAIAPLSPLPLSVTRQQSWPALAQLLTTIGGASPLAASYIRQAIPSTGDGFAQAFTAFLTRGAAVTSFPAAPGTLTVPLTLLPGQAEAARTADPQALRAALFQISMDLTGSAAKTSPAQPWQNHQVPVLTDYGISMAQLFVRQQIDPVDDEPGKRMATNSTRFLVEVSPSQLGPVQLDGLLRKTETNTSRLDLIVRTEFAVPSHAADEMAGLFQSTLGATGMVGTLGFQIGPENFVLPSSDSETPYRAGGERSI